MRGISPQRFVVITVRLLVSAAIVAATSLVTSHLLAQRVRPRSHRFLDVTGGQPSGATTTLVHDGDPQEDGDGPTIPGDAIFHYHMDDLLAVVQGNGVYVKTEVNLFDRRPDFKGIWTLRVYQQRPSGKTMIDEKHYLNQVFDLGGGGPMSPVFAEKVTLPAGVYALEVILTSLHESVDLSLLDDPVKGRQLHVSSGSRSIVVR